MAARVGPSRAALEDISNQCTLGQRSDSSARQRPQNSSLQLFTGCDDQAKITARVIFTLPALHWTCSCPNSCQRRSSETFARAASYKRTCSATRCLVANHWFPIMLVATPVRCMRAQMRRTPQRSRCDTGATQRRLLGAIAATGQMEHLLSMTTTSTRWTLRRHVMRHLMRTCIASRFMHRSKHQSIL